MKLKPFDAADFCTVRDVPYFLGMAALSLLRLRFRFCWHIVKICGRIVRRAL